MLLKTKNPKFKSIDENGIVHEYKDVGVYNGFFYIETDDEYFVDLGFESGDEILDVKKTEKIDELNKMFESKMSSITDEYPELEKLSWDKQEQEARAYLADNNVPTPLLDAISQSRGIPKDILAQKIIEKADAYSVAVGQAIGRRQALEDQINQATTIEELENIEW